MSETTPSTSIGKKLAQVAKIRARLTDQPPVASVKPICYEVNCLPEGDINASNFAITVEYRGDGRWAVCRHRENLAIDGTWSWESRTSEREDDWLERHRFDLDTALKLAREAAPHIIASRLTVPDALAMAAANTDEEREAVWAAIRSRLRARGNEK